MDPNNLRRPPSSSRSPMGSRPDGSSTVFEAGGKGAEGRPPGLPFVALFTCLVVSAACFFLGSNQDSPILQTLGFLFGSFISVISLAWFIVQDNTNRSLPYRDWRVSARSMVSWILVGSWVTGTANVFLLALDISRNFVE